MTTLKLVFFCLCITIMFMVNGAGAISHESNARPGPSNEPLVGKTIVINPGHGWYLNGSEWTLQRSYYFGVVEDFLNIDFARDLEKLLIAQGAIVYSTRELDSTAGNGESGNPKWQEASRYYLKSIGVDESIWNSISTLSEQNNDIRSRPLYANSLNADLLISIHTNGGGGTGTETWHDPSTGQPAQSKQLADIVNSKVIEFAQSYNPDWRNRGVKPTTDSNSKGELRLATMPTALIEVAFHDTEYPDNAALQDDTFKKSVAIAICNGILEYFGKSGSCERPILIDQAHDNYYGLEDNGDWSFHGFVETLTVHGINTESVSQSPITLNLLQGYSSYIIPLAQNAPAVQEIEAMQQYVQSGGSLFLIADWGGTFSDPSQALANVFGVILDANIVVDADDDIDPNDEISDCDCWIPYVGENFTSHRIMNGLSNIQSHASTGMLPGTAAPLIITDSNAEPANRAIAVALNYGSGRVVIVGDSNYFDSSSPNLSIDPINSAENRSFALNIMDWLLKKNTVQPPTAAGTFFDDGTSGTSNWESNTIWGIEVLNYSSSLRSASIDSVWSDSPGGNYQNNIDAPLTSIDIDLSSLSNPNLSFLTRFELEAGKDYGYVEASADEGISWVNLATYTGTATDWSNEQVGLRNFAGLSGIKIRFRLVSNESETFDGWYVDNIRISEGAPIFSSSIFLPVVTQ